METSQQASHFSLSWMILSNLWHGIRIAIAVALGVATATTVIVGALLVGDSMRGSLRALTIERLGKTEAVVIPGRFFHFEGIVSEDVNFIPLMFFPGGVIESQGDASQPGSVARAGSVQIVGCDDRFWQLDTSGVVPKTLPSGDDVVLNESTAAELGVKVGDLITIRLPVEQAVPADSPLGRREIESESLPRMKVVDILPDRGLGRFSVFANQASPYNVFVSRETIASVLDRDGQANALFFDQEISIDQLNIDLDDLGLQLNRVRKVFQSDDAQPNTIFDYYSLTSDQLLLPDKAVDRILAALPAGTTTPVTTYLANAIERVDGREGVSVPYSTISAIESTPTLPLNYRREESENRVPLVLNSWAAERLGASIGMPLRVLYYEPEVEKGKEIERGFDAVVTDIVEVTEPATRYWRGREATFDKPPTIYNDPDLTPNVPGVTDQESINDWDLPFKLKRKIDPPDDRYWNYYRLTPKAFLPLADGRRLFGSRFGQTTGLRISTAVAPQEELAKQIRESLTPILGDLGWSVRRIRQQQLTASRGTTPFDALFLSLSFFVIFAAVMLIAMLFRLGLLQRRRQFGTLMAIGWTPKQITKMTLAEGLLIAVDGVLLGVLGGICYAKLVLWALRSWWVGAVTVPFLQYHWTYASLILGASIGWGVAGLTLWLTIRSMLKSDAQTLLSGRDDDQQNSHVAGNRDTANKRDRLTRFAGIMILLAVAIAAAGALAGGQAAAGGFVGGGMLLLISILVLVYAQLRRPRRIDNQAELAEQYNVSTLAGRNAFRHPLRSTLTIGLMSTASFLIVAITAFRLQPTERGTGGFNLVAQSATPLYRDLSDKQIQTNLLGPDAKLLSKSHVVPVRMRPGQDASCNNLYQAAQPTVLGVPDDFGELINSTPELVGFDWAGHADVEEGQSPWQLLTQPAAGTEKDPVPVILDQNTAMWSLQMRGGVGETKSFEYESGEPIYFRVVGLLSNSMLQGRLIIGDKNFRERFPKLSGSQFFLISCPDDQRDPIASALESWLGDIGMDVSDSSAVLSGMLAVQNTYLRTFQSLGALGLLLGTIGLAISQLRSVLERRRELAVMRALGFTRGRLAQVVITETASLLLFGIGCGVLCAVLAVFPYAVVTGLRPPVMEPLLVVGGIILFGLLAGLLAVRQVMRMPLMDSLRPE